MAQPKPRSFGATCLQTDDTLIVKNKVFMNLENEQSKKFKQTNMEVLSEGTDQTFNGALISNKENHMLMIQPLHINKITLLYPNTFTKASYVSELARGTYKSTICGPDGLFKLSKCAQVQHPTKEDAAELSKALS